MLRHIAAGVAALVTSSVAISADAPFPFDRADRIVQEYVKNGQFMGTVLVARGDEVLFSKAYGSANLELNVPNTPDIRFRLGSLTKQFTATAILLLEERGKLSTSDPIKKFYAEAPAAWDGITLAQLLTHTSGVMNFTRLPEYGTFSLVATSPEELIKHFRDKPLDFPPGTEMRYSNSGYALLGLVIEKASGVPYAKFLQDNLFEPLGMKNTGYDVHSTVLPMRAAGYSPGPQGIRNSDYVNMSVPFAAGGLYSTTGDLLRWNQALYGGKVLKPTSLAKMQTPPKLAKESNYAFGIAIGNRAGQKVIEHGGDIDGFSTKLAYYPATGVTVVALSNLAGPGAGQIADRLGSVTQGEAVVLPSERVGIKLPAKVLQDYVGAYELWPGFDLVITVVDGQLVVTPTGQAPDPVVAEKKDQFFSKRVDAQLDFVRDAKGKVTKTILNQGGYASEARRK